jgi:hypothetical protein
MLHSLAESNPGGSDNFGDIFPAAPEYLSEAGAGVNVDRAEAKLHSRVNGPRNLHARRNVVQWILDTE